MDDPHQIVNVTMVPCPSCGAVAEQPCVQDDGSHYNGIVHLPRILYLVEWFRLRGQGKP